MIYFDGIYLNIIKTPDINSHHDIARAVTARPVRRCPTGLAENMINFLVIKMVGGYFVRPRQKSK
jgi:hypothetical protein